MLDYICVVYPFDSGEIPALPVTMMHRTNFCNFFVIFIYKLVNFQLGHTLCSNLFTKINFFDIFIYTMLNFQLDHTPYSMFIH